MNTNEVLNKLIAEIERRIDSWSIRGKNAPIGQGKDTCVSRVTELSDLLLFINSLQQEQLDLPSGEDVMLMCNQILIDWVKEGKTKKEKEQRKQAHIRFFELYDDYLMQEPLEVDLEKEIDNYLCPIQSWEVQEEPFTNLEKCARHFFELGLNTRKKE